MHFPSMLPAVVKPPRVFFSLSMLWALYLIGPISLAASCGVGTHRLQRPFIRAGTNTRHPILYASFDGSQKACRRRPHLYDGFFQGPEIARAASTSTKIEGDAAPQYRLYLFEGCPLR